MCTLSYQPKGFILLSIINLTQSQRVAVATMAVFIIALICVIVYYFYIKINSAYGYWEKRKIKGPKPQYLFGNFRPVITKKDSVTTLAANIYRQFSTEKVIGIYQGWEPALIVNDPELIKKVLVKHFQIFSSRGMRTSENNPLSRNLFATDGEEWRVLRQKLSPVFTSGKLKQMMPLMDNCIKQYLSYLDKLLERPDPIEMRSLKMKYTLKSITTIAFGLDIDTFTEDNCEFIEMAYKLFGPQNSKRIIRGLLPGFLKKLVGMNFESPKVINFFLDLVSTVAKEREGKPKVRKDFMDFMIDLKEQGTVTKSNGDKTVELEITDALVAAQAMVYYAAGFESSSGTMSFLLYELALNPKVQERCYKEIASVMEKNNGALTYEALHELNYLSMTFDETLRKYPVAGLIFRQSVTNYEIPELNLSLIKGTRVLIPVLGIQRDPNYYPDPEKFRPERFTLENKQTIQDCTYLPFGEGPRNCIGR